MNSKYIATMERVKAKVFDVVSSFLNRKKDIRNVMKRIMNFINKIAISPKNKKKFTYISKSSMVAN